MRSESAWMSSAEEVRYRLRSPASASRNIHVVALDATSDALVMRLKARGWSGVTFFRASTLPDRSQQSATLDEVAAADLVVMVAATGGGDTRDVSALGRICSDSRVMTTAIVIHPAAAMDVALSRILAQLRPWSLMVVVASDEGYVEDVLRSFR
jgi:hypothetical protein